MEIRTYPVVLNLLPVSTFPSSWHFNETGEVSAHLLFLSKNCTVACFVLRLLLLNSWWDHTKRGGAQIPVATVLAPSVINHQIQVLRLPPQKWKSSSKGEENLSTLHDWYPPISRHKAYTRCQTFPSPCFSRNWLTIANHVTTYQIISRCVVVFIDEQQWRR